MNIYDSLEQDLAAILADPTGPGEDVRIIKKGEVVPSAPLRGVFDRASQEAQPGSRVPVMSRRPMVVLQERDVLAAISRQLDKRDRILARGMEFFVETPQSDGLGTVAVKLLKADGSETTDGGRLK